MIDIEPLIDKRTGTLDQARRQLEYLFVLAVVEKTGSVIKAACKLQTSGVEIQRIMDHKGRWTP